MTVIDFRTRKIRESLNESIDNMDSGDIYQLLCETEIIQFDKDGNIVYNIEYV